MVEAAENGTGHAGTGRNVRRTAVWRREFLHPIMPLMLICPKCDGATELRGTMDVWYMTWCPDCERLWRVELHSLLNDKPEVTAERTSARRTRSRARPST
jgi:Zn-finger nucleic acid-binding protein